MTDNGITIRDVWNLTHEMSKEVSGLVSTVKAVSTNQADHDDRLRKIESRLFPLPVVTTLVGLGSLVIAAVAIFNR